MGFTLVSRANNHVLDWGVEGMRETTRHLDDAGIVHAGIGEDRGLAAAPSYLETPKGRIALIDFVLNADRVSPLPDASFALTLFATSAGGNVYTFQEYSRMLRAAGFHRVRRLDGDFGFRIVTASPRTR